MVPPSSGPATRPNYSLAHQNHASIQETGRLALRPALRVSKLPRTGDACAPLRSREVPDRPTGHLENGRGVTMVCANRFNECRSTSEDERISVGMMDGAVHCFVGEKNRCTVVPQALESSSLATRLPDIVGSQIGFIGSSLRFARHLAEDRAADAPNRLLLPLCDRSPEGIVRRARFCGLEELGVH